MAETVDRPESLRLSRRETERLGFALTLSLAAHLFLFGAYILGQELNLLPSLRALLKHPAIAQQPIQPQEQPLQFVMVNQPSTEAPENTRNYSSQNSRAANKDANQDANVPKLDGTHPDTLQTENVPKPEFNKLQPSPQPVSHEETKPAPALEPGDLTMANPKDLQQQQQQQRPRTLSQVLPHRLPQMLMHQDGGVHQIDLQSSLDAKASPFGSYDEQFIEAVTQRWYDLLDSQQFALDRTGKVEVQFHLNYDGTITDMQILDNTVGELLGHVCEDAIHDPAPFAVWPEDMRRLVGANYREITFTFYYY